VFKFSIITASYNRLKNLENLYDYILKNQNFTFKIEWVVIVEKQDTKTINFLNSIYKKNITIKIIINKYPGKFNTLIKQGIMNCTGDFLVILGDDDYIKKNSLINIYNFIKKKKPQWIISPVTYHDHRRKVIRKFITKIKSKLILLNLDILLPIVNYYMTPGIIISRNLIFRVNYFQKNSGTSNDWATWLDVLSLKKPHVLNKIYSSAGYSFNTISGGLDFDKYYYLIKTILHRRFNPITKLLSFLAVVIIFFSNLFSKSVIYLIALFKKQKILNEENNIIHITRNFSKTYQTGGIEQFIIQIVNKLKYMQQVISYSDIKDQYISHKKLNLYLFKKTINIFNDFFSFKILSFLIRQSLNYKIIHLHQPHPFSYFYILLLPFKKKIIVTYHSDILKFNYIKWVVKFIELLASRYIDVYHFSSEIYKKNCQLRRVKNFFIDTFSINKKKIKSENIRDNFIKYLPKKYVLFIGRDRHYKGFDKLKDIILLNPHINFVCLTNYKFDFKSKNLKKINNINDDEKIYLIKNSYIHINTSDSMAESFGFSILESLSFGVPSIVFNMNSGTNYLVRNNFNGYIIDNFNINLFSIKINDLYNNSKLYKIFKKNTFLDYKKRLAHNNEILEKKYTRLLNS
jgi:rhamnosyl/mannosyltransferase